MKRRLNEAAQAAELTQLAAAFFAQLPSRAAHDKRLYRHILITSAISAEKAKANGDDLRPMTLSRL